MKKNKQTKRFTISRNIQLIFISVALITYIQILVNNFRNFNFAHNHGFDFSVYVITAYNVFLPVLFFAAVYLSKKNKQLKSVNNLFETLILTVAAFMVFGFIDNYFWEIKTKLHQLNTSGFWPWFGPEIIFAVVSVLLFGWLVYWLRHTKRLPA